MYFKSLVVLSILIIVFCGENQGYVNRNVAPNHEHQDHHRHHKMTKLLTRFEVQPEKEKQAPAQPAKPTKHHGNADELRGVYFVVKLDESPPPKKEGTPLRRRKRAITKFLKSGGVAPTITTLAVQSSITNRFSTTDIRSVIQNVDNVDKEVTFVVQIPEKAFISNFTMLINEKLFIGEVKEKEQAEKEYEAAKKRKETAGKVSNVPRSPIQPARGMEIFSVAVNVAASSSVEFLLTYQQLLERKLGVYTQVISVRPNQVVEDLSIHVDITESQEIKFVNVSMNGPGQMNGTEPLGTLIDVITEQSQKISYIPNTDTQKLMDKEKGLNGDLKIMYDVAHAPEDAGMVCVDGDYFIHYFSPTGLDPLNKNVVFVIDVSGSMAGNKIKQTLTAMKAILDIMHPQDKFKFLLFHTTLNFWPKEGGLIPATLDNIYSAKKFLEGELKALGSTNINSALIEACRTLKSNNQYGSNIIVFLTDGQPTAGQTNPDQIVKNVVKEAEGKVTVFSLGFGNKYELDFDLLRKISYRTGVAEGAIRIYPGLEADEQLKQFFALVNTPLLFNVKIEYPLEVVIIDTITQNEFPQYFKGSELIVAGKLNPNRIEKQMSVVVGGVSTMEVRYQKEIDLSASCPVVPRGYAAKVYAYMKIKYLLIQAEKTDDKSLQQQIKQDALNLALENNLVTPLTSLVITQHMPDVENLYGEEDSSMFTASISVTGGTAMTSAAHSLVLVSLTIASLMPIL